MAFNYTPALELMQDGNITNAIISTYTTPLGAYAWWLVVLATLLITYIKTQSAGLTTMVGMVFLFGAKIYLGAIGDGMFWTLTILGGTILFVQFWRKD